MCADVCVDMRIDISIITRLVRLRLFAADTARHAAFLLLMAARVLFEPANALARRARPVRPVLALRVLLAHVAAVGRAR